MSAPSETRLTAEEYLAIERASETKHEFYRGEMFAMAGASHAHVRINTNLIFLLMDRLREQDCEVYGSDMRVKVDVTGLYTYPDLSVTCDSPRFEDESFDILLNPQLIIEVLSPSTEAYDRGKKFEHYQRIESLREYVLVSQEEPTVTRFTRSDDSRWTVEIVQGLQSQVRFDS
ncbi:MAG: Uma2 family endonuclease, partial [Planctomycetales bacterium]|nr:Uma2 family endonuclease [Planctomycetales bacterium]